MTVQDTVRTVSVPRQAGPAEPPTAHVEPTALAPLLGRDRPLTTDERQFAVGLAVLAAVLGTVIVVGLLVGQYVWS